VSLSFGTGTTVKDLAAYREWLRVGEDCGFELLTTGDSQSLWADPFVATTVAALSTTRPRLGITVSNPVTRHPAVVASSLVALQDLSGGRVAYGISSGDSALRNIGERPSTVDELGEFVVAVRDLCESGAATWRGHDVALRWGSAHVPIWFSPEGPRTQRLAGRLADGVVLSNALTREAIERAFTNIDVGAREVGRSIDDIEVWWMANVVPAATEAEGIGMVRSILAGTANHVFRFTLDGKGVPEEHRAGLEALKREYDSSHHASPETAMANAALADKYGLTEWLAGLSTIAGPDERCIERLHEVAEAGVTRLLLAQFVPDQIGFMRWFADRIAPHFA
jgi:5,10-methylenetetrahydromethanopterin reductase